MRSYVFCAWVVFFCVSGFSQSTPKISKEGQQCLECHSASTPGAVEQWRGSAHAKASVDCYSCHQANPGDPATFDHYGLKIAVIVTPYYCARCHKPEVDQFEKSRHADAAHLSAEASRPTPMTVQPSWRFSAADSGDAARSPTKSPEKHMLKATPQKRLIFSLLPRASSRP